MQDPQNCAMVKLILLVFSLVYAAQRTKATTVKWPSSYSVEWLYRSETTHYSRYSKVYVSQEEKSIRQDIFGGVNTIFTIWEGNAMKQYIYYPTTNDDAANVTHCIYYNCGTLWRWSPHKFLPDIWGLSYSENLTVNGAPAQKWSKKLVDNETEVWLQMGDQTKGPIPLRVEYKLRSYEKRDEFILEYYNYQPHEPEKSVWIRPQNVTCLKRESQVYEWGLSSIISLLSQPDPHRRAKGLKINDQYPNSASPFPYTDEEIYSMVRQLPDTFDWRFLGAVTPVKHQTYCYGGSWAFGVVGAMEGAYYLKTGFLGEMSEQALIDCGWVVDTNNGSDIQGCFGGDPRAAFDWIKNHGGLPWTADYGDYKGVNGRCSLNHVKTFGAIKGYVHVKADVDAVKVALYHHGPLTVSIFTPFALDYYHSGVFKYQGEVGHVDHAVLLIGYGTLNGDDYWLIKNSAGEQWGISGYGLISAEYNTLRLLDHVYYPEMI